jgi:hypothetical protein
MISPIEDTALIVPADQWRTVRSDPRFIELMRLARVTNSLALAYGPLLHPLEDQSPRARRDRFAAFFFAAALIKEALAIAEGLSRWFRELRQYREGFSVLLKDPSFIELRENLLKKVRNELVFHFDREAVVRGLARFPEDEDILIATFPPEGPQTGEMYFDAADDAILAYLFGDAVTTGEYVARLDAFMTEVTRLFNSYMTSAHRLIGAGFIEIGLKKQSRVRATGPLEEAD